ncbi:MAG: hypothetical protein U0263_32040 [Polyangiaceae bacterium]
MTPDAAITGFSAVGESRMDGVCSQYCKPDYTLCKWESESTVTCHITCPL